MGELTFPTTRAEIVDFLEATSAFWAKHDDYVSEESEQTSKSCYTTYFGNHWPKTADHRFGFCRERFVFAVSNLFLPWAICSCYDEFWIVSPVFVFAVNVCSLPGVILICSSEFYFLALNLILPWQLWATVALTCGDVWPPCCRARLERYVIHGESVFSEPRECAC